MTTSEGMRVTQLQKPGIRQDRLLRHELLTGGAVSMPARRKVRSGSATVVAMIFLVILVAMAAGIGATVMSSIHISRNSQAMDQAQAAAESGVQVMKNYLTDIKLASNVSDADVLDRLYDSLVTLAPVDGTVPLDPPPGHATEILFPQQSDLAKPTWIRLYPAPNLAAFKAAILPDLDPVTRQPTGNLILAVTGTDGRANITRTIYVGFKKKSGVGGNYGMFGYGVYSLGKIVASGGGAIAGPADVARIGSALLTGNSIALDGSVSIAGKVYVGGSRDQVTFGNNTVNGQTRPYWPESALAKWKTDNFVVEPPPAPPQFDPSVFRSYATTSYTPPATNAGGTHANFVIPANAGGFDKKGKPKILSISGNGSLKFEGIVYIESPNLIDFGGGPNNFNCTFVMAKNPNGATTDTITFSGNNSFGPIDSANAAYTSVRQATAGYSILAPTANVALTASSNATSKYVGSIVGWTVAMTGDSVFKIEDGSVISYSPSVSPASCNITGSSGVVFNRTPNYKPPVNGISGGSEAGPSGRWFVYDPSGYSELAGGAQ